MSADVTIDDYYIITGYVVSNRESRNAGDNIQSTPTSIDYTICDRTVYISKARTDDMDSISLQLLPMTMCSTVTTAYSSC